MVKEALSVESLDSSVVSVESLDSSVRSFICRILG